MRTVRRLKRISWPLLLAALLWAAGGASLHGDVIVLLNGDHIEGQVVTESARQVFIRRRFRDGNILFVQNVPRDLISRIEHGPVQSQPATTTSEAFDPESSLDAQTKALLSPPATEEWNRDGRLDVADLPSEIKDKPLFLRQTIAKWKTGNVSATAADVTRLLTNASRRELNALSPSCESQIGLSLADFAAEVHWQAAHRRAKSGAFRLTGVTPYEIPSMVPRLIKAYDEAIAGEVRPRTEEAPGKAPSPARVSTRPASGSIAATNPEGADPAAEASARVSIVGWLDRPNELNITRPEAAALTERIVYASSLLNERIRLDPAVRRDRTWQSALIGQRIRLIALLRAAAQRASGSPTARDRAMENERRRLQQEREAWRVDEQRRSERRQQETLVQKAMRLAQEQAIQGAAGGQTTPPTGASPVGPAAPAGASK